MGSVDCVVVGCVVVGEEVVCEERVGDDLNGGKPSRCRHTSQFKMSADKLFTSIGPLPKCVCGAMLGPLERMTALEGNDPLSGKP